MVTGDQEFYGVIVDMRYVGAGYSSNLNVTKLTIALHTARDLLM